MSPPQRHSRARRLQLLRTILAGGTPLTVHELRDRIGCSRASILRYLATLRKEGEPLVEEMDGATKRWRLLGGAKQLPVRVSRGEIVALLFASKVVGVFEGTGIDVDLRSSVEKLLATLRQSDVAVSKALDRKLLFVTSDGQRKYEGRADDVDELMTALLNQEPVDVTHESVDGGSRTFELRAYTLVVYRGGLYFTGWTSHRDQVRTFALDGFTSVTRRRGDHFDYPEDFDPKSIPGGASGLIRGDWTRVVLRFDRRVAKFVRRRLWHSSQTIEERDDGGVILRMKIEGTTELLSWLLRWGATVTVIEPAVLRKQLGEEARAMVERHCGELSEADLLLVGTERTGRIGTMAQPRARTDQPEHSAVM